MHNPLETFEDEHRHALQALDRLEGAATALEHEPGSDECITVVREVHRFLSTEVRRHNENEEVALFPLLGEEAPVEPFLADHRELRRLEQQLADALDRDPTGVAAVEPALAVVELLRSHIEREDLMLFPMSRTLLGEDGLAEVERRLEARTT